MRFILELRLLDGTTDRGRAAGMSTEEAHTTLAAYAFKRSAQISIVLSVLVPDFKGSINMLKKINV